MNIPHACWIRWPALMLGHRLGHVLRRLQLRVAAATMLAGLLGLAPPVRAAEPLVIDGVVAAPVAAVWSAWTTSEGLQAWLAPQADIDLRPDGLMRVQYQPQGRLGDASTIENRILAYEPLRMLALRVAKAPEGFAYRHRVGEMWTVLSFEPTADGQTRLRITSLGLADDDEAQRMRAYFDKGNRYTLALLQKRFQP